MKYISWITYGNEVIQVNQWSGLNNINCTSSCPFSITGDAILEKFEMNASDYDMDIGILFGIYFIIRFITYGVLLLRVYRFK